MSLVISTTRNTPVTLRGTDTPVFILQTGTVLDPGSAAAIGAPASLTVWSLSNLGEAESAFGEGVLFASAGTVTNGSPTLATPLIQGGLTGVEIGNGAGAVTNYGTIKGLVQFGVWLAAGGSVANGDDTHTASLINGNGSGVLLAGGLGTLTNGGVITAPAGAAVSIYSGGTVTNGSTANPGAIIAGGVDGVHTYTSPLQLVNFGSITGTLGSGAELEGGGTLHNGGVGALSASLKGAGCGALLLGDGLVANDGTIMGTAATGMGAWVAANGTIANGESGIAGAQITGGSFGAVISGVGVVSNYGSIRGQNSFGVWLGASGTIANSGTAATIAGANVGAIISGLVGSIDNLGTITGGSLFGAWLGVAGTVTNGRDASPGAQIIGAGDGLVVGSGVGTVDNRGTITGTSGFGLWLSSGGTLQNGSTANAGALISGGVVGLLLTGAAGQIANFGTIAGPGLLGAAIEAGGTLINGGPTNRAAVVTGGGYGVLLAGSGTEIDNFGTITAAIAVYAGDPAATTPEIVRNGGALVSTLGASGYAVDFVTPGNTLNVLPGASFVGKVEGGGGTLLLSGGTGTLSGLGSQFVHFQTVTVDPTAAFSLTGANTLAAGMTLAAGATLSLAAGSVLDLEGSLAGNPGSDVFAFAANARLIVGAPVAGGTGGQFAGAITGFTIGDRIDIAGITVSGQPVASVGAGGSVVITNGSGGTLYTFGSVSLAGAPTLTAGVDPISGRLFVGALPSGGDTVLQWDSVARAAIANDASAPPVGARALAIESLAVYDTTRAIAGLPGYSVTSAAPAGALPQAAVAAAANAVLDALYPAQAAVFDAVLSLTLGSIANSQGKTDGIALGRTIAAKELALRGNDGSAATPVSVGGTAVGQWRPTGPGYTPGLDPQYANVMPFAMTSPTQFTPGAAPDLTSFAYATAVNETASLGLRTSTTRTADQTQIAKFWNDQTGTDTPPGQWNLIAANVATAAGYTLAQDAKLFAELNVAEADAGIAAWNSKYGYTTWRPITAINLGGTSNPALTADPSWQPLLTTPNFPEYVAGHGSFSGAAATVLASFFGDATSFSATSQSLLGVTRSYTSFSSAATEAAMSRIYGGIHFRFSVDAGLTMGGQVGAWTLQQFGTTGASAPPRITLATTSGLSTSTNPVITGQMTGASGTALTVSYDGGHVFSAVSLDASGNFSVTPPYATDGTADGPRAVYFEANDPSGRVTDGSFGFVLATQAPSITLAATSLLDGGTLSAASILSGAVAPGRGTTITSLSESMDGGTPMPVAFDPTSGAFATGVNLFGAKAGAHSLVLKAVDAAGNAVTDTLHVSLPAPVPFVVTDLAPAANTTDVGVTYRPMVTFSRPVDPSTLTAASLYITDTAGARVPTAIATLANGTGAWLLPLGAMPGAATLTIHVDSAIIKATDGTPLDVSNNASAGSQLLEPFTTASTAFVPGTSITGIVVDPGPDNTPLTPDDVSSSTGSSVDFAHDTWKLPLAGVKVYVLGHEDQAIYTDATGHFTLTNVPAGDVKLAIDGRTATNPPAGYFFPELVHDLTIRPGVVNTVASALGAQNVRVAGQANPSVYIPRIHTDIFTPLSTTAPTVVQAPMDTAGSSGMNLTAQQISRLTITVQPNSLLDANGNPVANAQVGISPVPAALIKDELPPGLEQHTFDITVQTPGGAVLTQPATLTFPNVFGLAPGAKTYMVSFNHTTGRLEIDGTGTASADGLTVVSDPGSGVVQPGWHGYTDPKTKAKVKVIVKGPDGIKQVVFQDAQQAQIRLADLATGAGNVNNVVNTTDFAARQFEREFAKKIAAQTARFAPIGLGIDGVVLANDTNSAFADLARANSSGQLIDGLTVVEDGTKVLLDTAIGALDLATAGGVATAGTGIGAIEAVVAQGLKDVINGVSISLTVADFGLDFAGDYVARKYDNAGNSNANVLGPKFDPALVLHVSEDAWNGDAQITVSIDGVQVLGPTSITASHAANRTQDITIDGILGTDAHSVQVNFVNPASGATVSQQRNVFISGANFNGQEIAFSTPLYGADQSAASTTFSVGSVITKAQNAVDTAAQTSQNEFAFQHAIRLREAADLNTLLPIQSKFDTTKPNDGLSAAEVRTYLTAFQSFLNDAALLGGHTQTGTLVKNVLSTVSTGINALYGSTFTPLNPAPVNIPALSPADTVARDAAIAAGKPFTQVWQSFKGGGGTVGVATGTQTSSYTFYPPAQAQPALSSQDFGLLTAADGTQERFSFDPSKGIDRLMTPDTFYTLDAFDPKSGETGKSVFLSSASGTDTIVPDLAYVNDQSPAFADGLTKTQANIIGVNPAIASNLVPGVTDLAALQQGLFDTQQLPTASGIQASLPMKGEAQAIALAGTSNINGARTLALLATGSYGMAIADVSTPTRPVLLSQLQLPGKATDIAVDSQRQVAAVADGAGGLALISYAAPAAPTLLATVPGQFAHVVISGGIAYASSGGSVLAFDAMTGDQLGQLDGAPGSISGMAIDGAMLYTMDGANALRAVAVNNGNLTLIGSLILPGGGNGLVVGNNVATVPAGDNGGNGGFITVDVTDPRHPALIASDSIRSNAGSAVALNGSGLGLFTGQLQILGQGLLSELDVVNTSDPTNTATRAARFGLPAPAGGVAISGGVGFVADGTSGLQVVRYQAFVPNTVAPMVTVTTPPADIDPTTAGTQVLEGSTATLSVKIASPGQILSTELLLNGLSVLTDLQYPFNLSVVLPTIAANGSNVATVAVRATDTNGNVTTTAPLTLQLLPDLTPPRLLSATVSEGAVVSTDTHGLQFVFSKALQPGAASPGNFTLKDNAGNVIQPISVTLSANGRTVEAVYPGLAVGAYSYTVNAPQIFSTGGIALGSATSLSHFSVQAFTVSWARTTGGDWNTAANWTTGVIPIATDSVFIGTRQPVGFAAGARDAAILVDRNGELDLTGGSLTIAQQANLGGGTLNIQGGSFVANGLASVGSLIIGAGALTGSGTVTVNSNLNFAAGTMAGIGVTILGPTATASIGGRAVLARELDIAGTASVSGAWTLGGATAGILSVLAGGTLALPGSLTANAASGNLVRNAGTILAAGGTLRSVTVDGTGGGTLLATGTTTLNLATAIVLGGTLSAVAGGVIQTVDRGSLLQNTTITAGTTITDTNNNFLSLTGTIANAGTIALASVGNYTALVIAGAVTLAGAGGVVFSDNPENRIISNGAAATLLVQQSVTGAGRIGDGDANLSVINATTINATGANVLLINSPNALINNGLLEDTASGGLTIQSTTIVNAGGAVLAKGAGSHVDLVSSLIQGGTLATTGGGVIQAVDRGSVLQNVTIAPASQVVITNNNILTLAGTISNSGTIALASSGNYTALSIGGTVTLQASVMVALSDNSENRIIGAAGSKLTNLGTIAGGGRLGDGAATLALTNAAGGVINANGASQMLINFPGGTLANLGLIEATSAVAANGGLVISGTTIDDSGNANAGILLASGANAHIDLQSATIVGGSLQGIAGAVIRTVDRGSLLQNTTITAGTTITDTNNNFLSLTGTIANAGTIALASVGNYTALVIAGAVTLAGAGGVVFSDNPENRIISNGAAATLLVQQSVTGAGRIGDGDANLSVINATTINATGANVLLINSPNALINNGLLEDTASGGLTIQSTTIVNAGGAVLAKGAGSHVDLVSSLIQGGTLATTGGGVIQAVDRGSVLQNVTIAPASQVVITNNNILTLAGTISNSGTIALASSGNYTALAVAGQVSLLGAGMVSFSDNSENRIVSNGTASTLTNGGTIVGAGRIGDGDGNLTFVNQGVVNASGSSAIIVDTAGHAAANTGTLESTSAGGLTVNSALMNAGLVWARSGPVFISGAATGSGQDRISGSSQLEFGGSVASGQQVSFDAGSTGMLRLDDGVNFAGIIAGLATNATNAIDLRSLGFVAGSMATSYVGTSSGGTVKVTNGTGTIALSLTGNYVGAAFAVTPESSGHTLLSVQHP